MKEIKLSELFNRCLGANYIHTVEDGDYAIELDGDRLYLLFQWSHSHMDWVSNFDFPQKAYKNGDGKCEYALPFTKPRKICPHKVKLGDGA